jgi:hypothetical protein
MLFSFVSVHDDEIEHEMKSARGLSTNYVTSKECFAKDVLAKVVPGKDEPAKNVAKKWTLPRKLVFSSL